MRALPTFILSTASLFSGLAVSVAQTPTPSPSPTPPLHSEQFPLDTEQTPWGAFWIGWGELPWTLPSQVPVPKSALGTVNTPSIRFSSPLVPTLLTKVGVPVLIQQNGTMTVAVPTTNAPSGLPLTVPRRLTLGQTAQTVQLPQNLALKPIPKHKTSATPAPSPSPSPGTTLPQTTPDATELANVEMALFALQRELPSTRLLSVQDQSAVVQALLAAWTEFYTLAGPNIPHAVTHFAKERAALQLRADREGITPELLEDCRKYQAELSAAASQ